MECEVAVDLTLYTFSTRINKHEEGISMLLLQVAAANTTEERLDHCRGEELEGLEPGTNIQRKYLFLPPRSQISNLDNMSMKSAALHSIRQSNNDPIPIHPLPHRRSPHRASLPLHRHLPHSLRPLLDQGIRGPQSPWRREHCHHGNFGEQSVHVV